MSINALREELKDIPGGLTLTMGYEEGGAVQVFRLGDEEIRFGGHQSVSAGDIRAALDKKKL